MRSFKGINFGNLLSSMKEAEELLPDLKVGLCLALVHLAFQDELGVFVLYEEIG